MSGRPAAQARRSGRENFEELSQLDTLDMGAPISRTAQQAAVLACSDIRRAGDRAAWRDIENSRREISPTR